MNEPIVDEPIVDHAMRERPADQATRDRISRTALGSTLFVEAGAGTGKTTQLVDRIAQPRAAPRARGCRRSPPSRSPRQPRPSSPTRIRVSFRTGVGNAAGARGRAMPNGSRRPRPGGHLDPARLRQPDPGRVRGGGRPAAPGPRPRRGLLAARPRAAVGALRRPPVRRPRSRPGPHVRHRARHPARAHLPRRIHPQGRRLAPDPELGSARSRRRHGATGDRPHRFRSVRRAVAAVAGLPGQCTDPDDTLLSSSAHRLPTSPPSSRSTTTIASSGCIKGLDPLKVGNSGRKQAWHGDVSAAREVIGAVNDAVGEVVADATDVVLRHLLVAHRPSRSSTRRRPARRGWARVPRPARAGPRPAAHHRPTPGGACTSATPTCCSTSSRTPTPSRSSWPCSSPRRSNRALRSTTLPSRGSNWPSTRAAVLRRRPEAVDLPVPAGRHRAVPRRPRPIRSRRCAGSG